MTSLQTRHEGQAEPAAPAGGSTPSRSGGSVRRPPVPWTGRRAVWALGSWLVALLLGSAIAAVALGALSESRAQRQLLGDFRTQVSAAAEAAEGPFGGIEVTDPPATGTPVALLQIGRLGLQRVVVEGARPGDTQAGPGHVPGTAGPGQPGNSGIVGRRAAYGGAFGQLGELAVGDEILVTTVQGQTVYRVSENREIPVAALDAALDPSTNDRLTLVGGGGLRPGSTARVVTAPLTGRPFPPTAQGGRTLETGGGTGQSGSWPLVIIWGGLLLGTAAAAGWLYRRWYARSTYLLSTPALVALLVLTADALTRLLPAWT